ncbi:hypothetical protein [Sorangium atrum]|uniref:Uncharacterized protein n=1 Tax=Sorangium atrum TaxID=2995308 RepID=A0ABT5C3Q3_9BACT|nr:hypothetical protein [Sorangium aterium]MDC0680318.1 hypothetical protein [Sorangium aterium]
MSAAERGRQAGRAHQREPQIEGLTIERYAEVMAYRRHFPAARAIEVLLRLGVQPARWDAATRGWGTAMSSALARDEPEILTRFAKALATQERRLREFPPRIESLGEPVAQQGDTDGARAFEGERAAERPSYLRDEAASAPREAASAPWPAPPAEPAPGALRNLHGTAEMSRFVPRPTLPFQELDPAREPSKKR